jgi:uncharacterized DUF497 family protein
MSILFTSKRRKKKLQNLSLSLAHLQGIQQNQSQNQSQNQKSKSDLEENELAVAMIGDRGFWVKDNKFMTALILDDELDPSMAEEIDVYKIPSDHLGHMFKILDKIYEEE